MTAIKRLLLWVLASVRAERLFLQRLSHGNLAVVLNLHRVSPVCNPYWPSLSPVLFEDLLRFLREEFTVTTLAGLAEARDGGKPVAVLSFDDGYADFMEHAAPLLRKYEIKANLNIIPAAVESGRPPWNVRLYDWMATVSTEELNSISLPGFNARLAADDPASKVRFGLAISRFLKMRPRQQRDQLWSKLDAAVGSVPARLQTRMMSRQDVLEAARQHEIGAHSYTHESMGFETDEFFQADFQRCRACFSDTLGLPLLIYAFPNGSYRAEQVSYLLGQGIRHVLLVDGKIGRPEARVLPRIPVAAQSKTEIRLTASGYRSRGVL